MSAYMATWEGMEEQMIQVLMQSITVKEFEESRKQFVVDLIMQNMTI